MVYEQNSNNIVNRKLDEQFLSLIIIRKHSKCVKFSKNLMGFVT